MRLVWRFFLFSSCFIYVFSSVHYNCKSNGTWRFLRWKSEFTLLFVILSRVPCTCASIKSSSQQTKKALCFHQRNGLTKQVSISQIVAFNMYFVFRLCSLYSLSIYWNIQIVSIQIPIHLYCLLLGMYDDICN